MTLLMEEIRINVRTTAEIKRDLGITARLRGLTVSSLVNMLVVRAIREEKEIEPAAFRAFAGRKVAPKSSSKIPLEDDSDTDRLRRTG